MLLSVVHTYSILYSRRVHQKDKKWADGKFKFYELNNKLEIISDEGMLVASDFLPTERNRVRESGIFEPGKTFVIPSGIVLVEFIDYLGVSNRNIIMPVGKAQAITLLDKKLHMKITGSENFTSASRVIDTKVSQYPELQKIAQLEDTTTQKPSTFNSSRSCSIKTLGGEAGPILEVFEPRIKRFTSRIRPGSNRMSQLISNRVGKF